MAKHPHSLGTTWLLVALAAWAISFAFLFWQQWDYIASEFLYLDDSNWLPEALQIGLHRTPSHLWHLYLLSFLGSIPIYKISSLALLAVAPAIVAALFYRLTDARLLSVGGSLFLVSYPLAVDQSAAYVTAVHPTYGTVLALASLGVLWLAWKAPLPKFLFGIGTAGLLAYLSSLVSPTTRLMVLAPVLWVAVMSAYRWPGWKRCTYALLLLSIPLAFRLLQKITDYGYSGISGRVDVSIPTMSASVVEAAESILAPIAGASQVGLWLYLVGLAPLIAAIIIGIRATRARGDAQGQLSATGADIVVFLALCLLTSVLVFGPSSILTLFRPRYALPAFLFVGVGVGAAAIWLVKKRGALTTSLALFGMVVLIAANFVRGNEMGTAMFGDALRTHKRLAALVEEERHLWGERAQVVIILTPGQRSPTEGWTEWSTWYLRRLAGHTSLTGLVGGVDLVGKDPFIAKPEVDGRLRMRGLGENVPLYLYEADEKGSTFIPKDVVFLHVDPSRVKFAKFGTAAASLSLGSLPWHSCEDLRKSAFIWPVSQEPLGSQAAGQHFVFNGDRVQQETLAVERGSLARLSFRLHSEGANEDGPASDSRPQMPILSEAVAIYRRSWGFIVTSPQDAEQKWPVKGGSEGAFLEIAGIEGCMMHLLANGRMLGRLPTARLSGEWSLGRGVAKRYWHGEISNWRLTQSPLLVAR